VEFIVPFFKTTNNIFKDFGEYFDPNWMNYDTVQTPEWKEWDYKRELTIEDVNLWEVIFEDRWSLYASFDPYAEFYILVPHYSLPNSSLEIFYGKGATKALYKRLGELGLRAPKNTVWIPADKMWLYSDN
jgi:hypothetical protein